jgi:hypothetical protein
MPRFSAHLSVAALALVTIAASASIPTADAADCKFVRGTLEETQIVGPECTSAVGLCTVAQMSGQLKGEARFTATAVTPSVDTPTTGVVFVIGDTTVVDARLGSQSGALSIKNAAAFRTVGDGDLSDTQVIIGGTDELAGADGSLRISGTFVAGSGTASFEGTVCLP